MINDDGNTRLCTFTLFYPIYEVCTLHTQRVAASISYYNRVNKLSEYLQRISILTNPMYNINNLYTKCKGMLMLFMHIGVYIRVSLV